jgi:hypothetical protein
MFLLPAHAIRLGNLAAATYDPAYDQPERFCVMRALLRRALYSRLVSRRFPVGVEGQPRCRRFRRTAEGLTPNFPHSRPSPQTCDVTNLLPEAQHGYW